MNVKQWSAHPHLRWLIPSALLLSLVFFYWNARYRETPYANDSNIYLLGAQGLATGHGYAMMGYIDTPPIGLYPPMQSWYLSLFWRIRGDFPSNIPLLYGAMIFLGVLNGFVAYALFVHFKLPRWLAAIAAFCMGCATMWARTLFLFTADPGFNLFCLMLMLLWVRRKAPSSPAVWMFTGIMIALAFWWRTATLGIIGGISVVAFWLAWERGWKPVLCFLVPVTATVIGWTWISAGRATYGVNFDSFWKGFGGWEGYVSLVADNLWWQFRGIPFWETICPPMHRIPIVLARSSSILGGVARCASVLGFWVLMTLAILGWKTVANRRLRALTVIAGVYVVQILLTPIPAWHSHRYFFVLLPFLIILIWHGILRLANTPQRIRLAKIVAGSVASLFILANLQFSLQNSTIGQDPSPLRDLHELATWCKKNIPADKNIAMSSTLPVAHFMQWSGRPLLEDYLLGPGAFNPIPVTHRQQHFRPAHYLITAQPSESLTLMPNLFTTVHISPRALYYLLLVEPEAERQYRLKMNWPPPPS